jgi:hypothetical protein
MKTAVEWLVNELRNGKEFNDELIEKAKEMEKEHKIAFARLHVQKALKAVENEMILSASAVKHWYLPETIK